MDISSLRFPELVAGEPQACRGETSALVSEEVGSMSPVPVDS